MKGMKSKLTQALLTTAAIAVAGCSSSTRSSVKSDAQNATNSVAETAARNIATQQGEEQFKNAKHELSGPLTCKAIVGSDAAKLNIDCTGTTKAGAAATLKGTTNELPGASVVSLNGSFVGSVDGAEVFTTQRLGG
jgi:Tfp pilus assembly protein PilV